MVIAQQLPRDILDSREKIQHLIDNPGEWGPRLHKTFSFEEAKPPQPTKPAPIAPGFPAIGEEFELTFDGDALENQPLEMVRRDGYDRSDKWEFTGRKVVGKQIRRFKLVRVGYCHNFDEVKNKLAAMASK